MSSRLHRANAPASASAYPPLSPQELVRAAEMFEWRPRIPLKFHMGSLDAMYREGKTYLEERNYAKAYVLLLRYTIICVDKVPTHPEASTPDGRRLLKMAMRRLKTVMPLLESIKTYLIEARSRWMTERGGIANDPGDTGTAAGDSMGSDEADAVFAARDPALSWNPHAQVQLLDASEHVDLAIQLVNQRQGTDLSGHEGTAGGDASNDTTHDMERARWQLDAMARRQDSTSYDDDDRSNPLPVTYNYPSVHQSAPVQYDAMRFDTTDTSASAPRTPRPQLPPKQPKQPTSASLSVSSWREDKASVPSPPPPPMLPNSPSPSNAPLPSRFRDDLFSLHQSLPSSTTPIPAPPPAVAPRPPPKTKMVEDAGATALPPVLPAKKSSSQYTFKPAAYLENGTPIRSVFLPDTLRDRFLQLAQPNTARGIETCGILCGRTANNALFITCLLIPQQVGTPDSCETTGEIETLEYCSAEDLIQIGWIHTHPTQTCFMSSLDLHTHAGYQMMMDESIAIVCAPRFEPHWGIFRLTNPPGLPFIGACRKDGAFHEHSLPARELYTEALNPPGHVFVVPGIDYKVADLRK